MQHFHPRLLLLLHSTQGQGGLSAPFCPVLEAPKILPHLIGRAEHHTPVLSPLSLFLFFSSGARQSGGIKGPG